MFRMMMSRAEMCSKRMIASNINLDVIAPYEGKDILDIVMQNIGKKGA